MDEDADAVAGLFLAMPELVEFNINPVFLYRNGTCAVEASFYLHDATPRKRHAVLLGRAPCIGLFG